MFNSFCSTWNLTAIWTPSSQLTENATARIQASDSGRVSILSLLDLSAAFDTIDHDILTKKKKKKKRKKTTHHSWLFCNGPRRFTSYLSCRTQSVFVGHESTPSALKCGVSQSSVLGPLLFILYTQSLSTVICQAGHSYHFFADDPQFHNSDNLSDFPALVHSLKDYIEDVAEWMSDSMLKMIHDKTGLIAFGTKSKVSQIIPFLLLCPYLVKTYHSPSLLEILVSL